MRKRFVCNLYSILFFYKKTLYRWNNKTMSSNLVQIFVMQPLTRLQNT